MKKIILNFLFLSTIYKPIIAQYKIISLPNITLTFSQKNYYGKYAGEVNEANQPNGYGLFTFKDSAAYIVGQFVNGYLSGNVAMLDSNTHSASLSNIENGLSNTSFEFHDKDLRYYKIINGLNYPLRTCYFLNNKIYAMCRSGIEINKPTLSVFSLDYTDASSPTVKYSSAVDKDGKKDDSNVEFYYSNNTAITTVYNHGTKTFNGSGYKSGGYHRDEDIATHLNNKVPYWLQGAQFWEVNSSKDLIFLKNPQSLGLNTAYGMNWIINANRNEASLNVSAFTNWVKPAGFLQKIEVSNAKKYDYYMGNFILNDNRVSYGVGVVTLCYSDKNEFNMCAGNIFINEAGTIITKSGFTITNKDDNFFICIGNLENNTNMINGYYIVPDKQFFLRGKFDVGYTKAIGEAVIKGSTLTSKYKFENTIVTELKEISTFNRITQSDLFNVQIDTEIK